MRNMPRRLLAALTLLMVAFALVNPGQARASTYEVTILTEGGPYAVGSPLTLRAQATESGIPVPNANLRLNYGSVDANLYTDDNGVASIDASVLGCRVTFYATWVGTTARASLDITGAYASTTTLSVNGNPLTEGDSAILKARIRSPETSDAYHLLGNVSFSTETGVLGTADVTVISGKALAQLPHTFTTAGTETITAAFTPISCAMPSESAPYLLTVNPDTNVDTDPVTVNRSRFFPVKDGYKDTIITSGMLHELGRVRVQVWTGSSGGHKVWERSYTTSEPEWPYSTVWKGRSDSGDLQPAGTYRFIHRYRDEYGNTKSITSSTFKLDRRQLAWHTMSTVVKDAARFDNKGHGCDGSVSRDASSYGDGVRLNGGGGCGWAAVSYRLPLSSTWSPSNSVYRRVYFSVRGRVPGEKDAAGIRIYNTSRGETWEINSYDHDQMTRRSYGWSTTSAPKKRHVDGGVVYGLILVGDGGAYDAETVRAKFRYAVLV